MGHSQADKAQTRQRLVEAASVRFREKGLDGISLADLMKDLGLTHGGFYKHFASRDALVAEALDHALADSERGMLGFLYKDGAASVERYIKSYLSESHRDRPGSGCAATALSADVARKGEEVQASYRAQLERNLEILGKELDLPAAEQRGEAMLLLATMCGTLLMARGAGDSKLSREILRTMRDKLLQRV